MWDNTFGRWGTPGHPVELNPRAVKFLFAHLGPGNPTPSPTTAMTCPESRLRASDIAALADAVGSTRLHLADAIRLTHSAGSSLLDYINIRDGNIASVPDAVLNPLSSEQISAVLRYCSQHDIAVVPFGGGTSVVGGVDPSRGAHRAVIAVDLRDMSKIVSFDDVSGICVVEAGITGPILERYLNARGFTWGHFPQSWERATIGGYAATRSAGQASSGYGRSNESIEAVRMVTPTGVIECGRGPSSAAGPDLRQLALGSEGVLGIITQVTLRARRKPMWSHYEGVFFPQFSAGLDAFRGMVQDGLQATVMRLSDQAETRTTMALSGPTGRVGDLLGQYLDKRGVADGCLAILGWEASSASFGRAKRKAAWAHVRGQGGVTVSSKFGSAWREHRFSGPFLRDVLLDRGYIVETLETATSWREMPALHARVLGTLDRDLRSTSQNHAYVMSHVSHVYDTGASLYVTALAPAQSDRRRQWLQAKTAASDALVQSAATITHHHGIGTDHVAWMQAEIGDLGIRAIRAVKSDWDPANILNPGKLLPDAASPQSTPSPPASPPSVPSPSTPSLDR